MRLPLPQFKKLCGPWLADPEVFGLKISGYDGAPHLEVQDLDKLQSTLHAIEESVEPGDKYGCELHGSLRRLRDTYGA